MARSGEPVAAGSKHAWHGAPDGGATFPSSDGGWIYVSNAELDAGRGGASALRFAADGRVTYHRDYWDAAGELYAKLPLVGPLLRFLARKMG